jgi:hypothetical protein
MDGLLEFNVEEFNSSDAEEFDSSDDEEFDSFSNDIPHDVHIPNYKVIRGEFLEIFVRLEECLIANDYTLIPSLHFEVPTHRFTLRKDDIYTLVTIQLLENEIMITCEYENNGTDLRFHATIHFRLVSEFSNMAFSNGNGHPNPQHIRLLNNIIICSNYAKNYFESYGRFRQAISRVVHYISPNETYNIDSLFD